MKYLKSFTLIELLIVIVIIGILATALIPRLTGIQAKAKDTARIADLRQLQNAIELYYVDNGSYPGNGHYANNINTGCDHAARGAALWTGIFNSTFQQNYLSSLPTDPRGTDPKYCYAYTRIDDTAMSCVYKDGTVVQIDGDDGSGNITGPAYGYIIIFRSETDLRDTYPRRLNSGTNRYCILGPKQ